MTKRRFLQILVGLAVLLGALVFYSVSYFQFFPWKSIVYIIIGLLSVVGVIFAFNQKYKVAKLSFGLVAVGGLAGLIIHSMINGIEIVVGPKTGKFLFMKEQYGLINTQDFLIIIMILIIITSMLSIINNKLGEQ